MKDSLENLKKQLDNRLSHNIKIPQYFYNIYTLKVYEVIKINDKGVFITDLFNHYYDSIPQIKFLLDYKEFIWEDAPIDAKLNYLRSMILTINIDRIPNFKTPK